MKIEIMGGKCANCARYTQYYCYSADRLLCAIDSGYCEAKSRNVRPGDRCRDFECKEKLIMRNAGKCESCGQYAPFYCAWAEGKPQTIDSGWCLNDLKVVNPWNACEEWTERRKVKTEETSTTSDT